MAIFDAEPSKRNLTVEQFVCKWYFKPSWPPSLQQQQKFSIWFGENSFLVLKRDSRGGIFVSRSFKGHFCVALFLLSRGFYAKMHYEYLCNKNEEKIYRIWLTSGKKRGTICIDVTIKSYHSEELKGLLYGSLDSYILNHSCKSCVIHRGMMSFLRFLPKCIYILHHKYFNLNAAHFFE